MSGGVPSGWYPEPGSGRSRWWDGSAWGAFQEIVVEAEDAAPAVIAVATPPAVARVAAATVGSQPLAVAQPVAATPPGPAPLPVPAAPPVAVAAPVAAPPVPAAPLVAAAPSDSWPTPASTANTPAPQPATAATPAYVPAGAIPSYFAATNAPRPPGNGIAIAALILGIWGFLTTGIPLFVGLFLGAVPDILAIVFGIVGIVRANRIGGRGRVPATFGLVLGGLAFVSIFFGAGTIW